MSLGEIGSGRSSIKGAITHYARALSEAPLSAVELRTRLRIISAATSSAALSGDFSGGTQCHKG